MSPAYYSVTGVNLFYRVMQDGSFITGQCVNTAIITPDVDDLRHLNAIGPSRLVSYRRTDGTRVSCSALFCYADVR